MKKVGLAMWLLWFFYVGSERALALLHQLPQSSSCVRSLGVLRAELVLMEMPLRERSSPEVVQWVQSWCESMGGADSMMPMLTASSRSGAKMRFVALPEDGIDCVVEGPGADSPFGRIVVERVSGSNRRGGQANSLARDAEERIVRRLRRDVELQLLRGQQEQSLPQHESSPATETRPEPQMMDSTLYSGDYGPEFKKAAVDLVEPNDEMDETVRKMFEKGEEIALMAARAKGGADARLPDFSSSDEAAKLFDDDAGPQLAAFEVSLGNNLKGGIDIMAGPGDFASPDAAVDAAVYDDDAGDRPSEKVAVDISVETRARFDVLVREVMSVEKDQVDLVLDAYRDVLLDSSFATLARDAMSSTEDPEKLGPVLEILNAKVVDLATQLAEMARFAEKQHLETIGLICQAAKNDQLEVALKGSLRSRLDSDFVAYLAYAVDREPPGSDFRLVLESVKRNVYAELAKDLRGPLEVFDTVLNLKDKDMRTQVLKYNLDDMGTNTRAHFFKTARNIFDNLLREDDQTVGKKIDAYFAARLIQFKQDLLHLYPDEAKAALEGDLPFPTTEDVPSYVRDQRAQSEVVAGRGMSSIVRFDDEDFDDDNNDGSMLLNPALGGLSPAHEEGEEERRISAIPVPGTSTHVSF